VKLLIDANLSPRVAIALGEAGFDVAHVSESGLLKASDHEILDRALAEGRAVVTADSDFGALLALRRTASPSVVQLRQVTELGPEAHVTLLLTSLPSLGADSEVLFDATVGHPDRAVEDLIDRIDTEFLDHLVYLAPDANLDHHTLGGDRA
jgi:predicted nuclease of predicted toxin-antitoxin system